MLGVLFMVISAIRAITQFIGSIIAASSTEKAIKKLRDRLFAHIQFLPLSYHKKTPTGEMVQRCTGDIDTVRRFILNDVVEVIRLSAVFVGAFIMMVSVHVQYALIAIALVPVIVITSYFFFKKEGKIWEEHEDEQDKLTGIIEENISGIRVVQAFAKEDYEVKKFEKQNLVKRGVGIRHMLLHTHFWPFSDMLINLQVTISLMAGGYFVLNNAISIGEFASFFTYSIMVTWPLRHVGRVVSQMGMAAVAMQRMSAILESDPEDYSGRQNGVKFKGEIEFKNVTFKYDGEDQKNVIRDVNFKIQPGEKVALIGPTGAGKSTLIALLTRFYDPQEGQVLIDGHDVSELDKTYLRSRIGVSLQKPFMFSTTIKGNIAYSKPRNASEEMVYDAAKAASIHNVLDKFQDGFDTLVGEKGVTLSGGQKQRVSLARTLLANPDIMVLDDATSAVDAETEFQIQDALRDKASGRTTIIISHRITSIQLADRIIVIEDGQVPALRTHEELANSPGFYRELLDRHLAFG